MIVPACHRSRSWRLLRQPDPRVCLPDRPVRSMSLPPQRKITRQRCIGKTTPPGSSSFPKAGFPSSLKPGFGRAFFVEGPLSLPSVSKPGLSAHGDCFFLPSVSKSGLSAHGGRLFLPSVSKSGLSAHDDCFFLPLVSKGGCFTHRGYADGGERRVGRR